MSFETLLLSGSDIKSLLTVDDVVSAVERVLRDHGDGRVVMPPKVSLDLGDHDRWPHLNAFINAMPAYVSSLEIAGLKWAGGFWDNRRRGLPSVMGQIVLTEPSSGRCLAVMDGSWITAIRTAAVTAVAARYLVGRPIRSVALCGAGVQGRTHLRVFDRLFGPSEFRVHDVDRQALHAFAVEATKIVRAKIRACESVQEATSNADVVVTATDARTPFLRASYLTSGSLVCAIGSYSEIHDDVVEWATVTVVDDMEQVKHRGNLARLFDNGRIREEDISFHLGEIVAGKVSLAEIPKENKLVVLIGMGSEDMAVAKEAYNRAVERGVGVRFSFESDRPVYTE